MINIKLCTQKEIALTNQDILKNGCQGLQKVSHINNCKNFMIIKFKGDE